MPEEVHTRLNLLQELREPERLIEIADVGASRSSTPACRPLLATGLSRVSGFGPQESAFEALEPMQPDTARFFPFAAGDGTLGELKVCGKSGVASLLEPNIETFGSPARDHRACGVPELVEMPTKRLDGIDGLGEVDFLDTDIQGGEVDVLRHGSGALKIRAAGMTEAALVPLYEDQPVIDTQMGVLRQLGFHPHTFMFVKSIPISSKLAGAKIPSAPARSQPIDGDALVINDLYDLGNAPDERPEHLALLADGCWRSPDLAVRCLAPLNWSCGHDLPGRARRPT